jgi:hypothetical protein
LSDSERINDDMQAMRAECSRSAESIVRGPPNRSLEATMHRLISLAVTVMALCMLVSIPSQAWFDQLASGKGLCCSFADGVSVENVDWDTQNGRYRVRIQGQWLVVPDTAVVTEPNKYGPAVVWPYQDANGATQIRCFLPGAGA